MKIDCSSVWLTGEILDAVGVGRYYDRFGGLLEKKKGIYRETYES